MILLIVFLVLSVVLNVFVIRNWLAAEKRLHKFGQSSLYKRLKNSSLYKKLQKLFENEPENDR